jgi:hypothetical protein
VVIGWHADEGDAAGERLSLRPGLAGVIGDLVAGRAVAVAVTTPENLDDDIVVQEVLAREFARRGGVLLAATGSQAGRRDRERIRDMLERAENARHELVAVYRSAGD